jgi:hypothetical protein
VDAHRRGACVGGMGQRGCCAVVGSMVGVRVVPVFAVRGTGSELVRGWVGVLAPTSIRIAIGIQLGR